jgi:UDP-N-acetylglucosamine 1-carboxyvinyltransferase
MDKIVISGAFRFAGGSGQRSKKLCATHPCVHDSRGGECVISNLPRVVDVVTMGKLLGMLGAEVHHEGNRAVVKADVIRSTQAPTNW